MKKESDQNQMGEITVWKILTGKGLVRLRLKILDIDFQSRFLYSDVEAESALAPFKKTTNFIIDCHSKGIKS